MTVFPNDHFSVQSVMLHAAAATNTGPNKSVRSIESTSGTRICYCKTYASINVDVSVEQVILRRI